MPTIASANNKVTAHHWGVFIYKYLLHKVNRNAWDAKKILPAGKLCKSQSQIIAEIISILAFLESSCCSFVSLSLKSYVGRQRAGSKARAVLGKLLLGLVV